MAYGIGGTAAYGMICDLAELIVGMDPLQTEMCIRDRPTANKEMQINIPDFLKNKR